MAIGSILNRKLTTCTRDAGIREVARLMREEEVGAVLVIENRKPIGIITDRDLVLRGLTSSRDISDLGVDDVMSVAIETASEHDGIYNVIQKMRSGGVRRIPVVNSFGEAIGLLSFDDLFELIADEVVALKDIIQPREAKLVDVA